MAITDKLNAAWADNVMQDSTFEFRATTETCYEVILQTVEMMTNILARAEFAGVDAEIKAEGQAVRAIINSTKTALDTHVAFLKWKQPT